MEQWYDDVHTQQQVHHQEVPLLPEHARFGERVGHGDLNLSVDPAIAPCIQSQSLELDI